MQPKFRKAQPQKRKAPIRRRLVAPVARFVQKVRKSKPMAGPTMSLGAKKYAAALLHPFSPLAEGATYPEPFAASTTTRKVRFEMAVQPTAAGNFDLCVQPHLLYSAFSGQGTITGAPIENLITNLPSGCKYYGSMSSASLSATYKSYRVVGYGVRIKSNVDFTKSGGRIYVAVMPASQQVPMAVTTGCSASNFYDCFDVPHEALAGVGTSGRVISSTIVGLPRGHQLAVSELMSNSGVEITFPIVSAAATHFLESSNQVFEQGLVTGSGGSTIDQRASLGYASCNGHSQLLIRGLGINVDATSALVVEVLYHIEGVPNPLTSGSTTMVEAVRKPAPATPNEISAILHAAGNVPTVQYVADKVRASAGNWATRAKSALASRAGQEAEKLLGVGMKSLLLL